ncbi:SUKH-4 family immunity protein [Streptomyces platensis]|uniref:SUKH-4 family immunity protein n=1 Tax=Streptomyces platensis TaxID=58346 RepID=UPI00386FD083
MAVDPADGRVCNFPEGEDSCIPLHRDVESLTYSLLALKGFGNSVQRGADREASAAQMWHAIDSFDPIPFADAESEWNVIYGEIEDGVW